MNYITHSLGGAVAGALVISASGVSEPTQQATIMAGAVLGALFIDIDSKNSWISHKVPIAGEITSDLFKHRGLVHTPVFIIFAAIILNCLNWSWLQHWIYLSPFVIKGLVPGMFSHIVLDTLNVQGIMWLWPLTNKRFHVLCIRTNSFPEGIVTIVLATGVILNYKLLFY